MKTYNNIWKIKTSQRYDYTTGFALDISYCKEYFKIIPIDLCQE